MKFRVVQRAWWLFWAKGMVVWPFMLFRSEQDMMNDRLFRHELEHCYQVKRCGRLKFYAAYIWLWLLNGYRNHPFEIAARAVQDEPLTQDEQIWRAQRKVRL